MRVSLSARTASGTSVPPSVPLSHYGSLVCPECVRAGPLEETGAGLLCPSCGHVYSLRMGIPVFASEPGYWNNVDRDRMQRLLTEAEESGDWLTAMERLMPHCIPAVAPRYRADAQFMLPIRSDSKVLDAGSMWGGLSFPIAAYCGEVYAVDKTWETLRLLDIRARQTGTVNIRPVLASISRLPFPDDFFDFVVLNGVLEWLATDQDVVVDEHLKGQWKNRHRYTASPEQIQLAAVRELCRVTKPEGGLYVAIENRIGLQYFFGWPDDHVNIPFVTILPRPIANVITRTLRNSDYRTYIYSPAKLAELLRRAGYRDVKLHAVHPYYGKISTFVPFSIFRHVRSLAMTTYPDPRFLLFSRVWRLTPRPLTHRVAPSLGAIATKSAGPQPARLLRMLGEVGVLQADKLGRYEAALVNSRFGDLQTVNHVIYDCVASKPVFFCKVSRSPGSGLLERESRLLRYAATKLAGTALASRIPNLVYYGVVEGIPIQVTLFMDQRVRQEGFWGYLRRLDKVVDFRATRFAAAFECLQMFAGRRWLLTIDATMRRAIEFLVQFERETTVRMITIPDDYQHILESRRADIKANGLLSPAVQKLVELFSAKLASLPRAGIPICMEHGDFDLCNLLGDPPSLALVDFEHAEEEGLQFFDLGNLIFSPLVTQWKTGRRRLTIEEYARQSGWMPFLQAWVARYAELSGMSTALLELLPGLTAIEQNAKRFPAWRDPFSYPMFGEEVLLEMLGWRLSLEL